MTTPTGARTAPVVPAAAPMHPADLALRFALELGALGSLGWSAATLAGGGAAGVVAAVAAPALAAAAWVTFAVLGDPSRSGRAPVPVSGRVRILLEAAVFAPAIIGLALLGAPLLAGGFAGGLVAHTALSADRMRWLWHTPRPTGR